jgi:hypothetical protein
MCLREKHSTDLISVAAGTATATRATAAASGRGTTDVLPRSLALARWRRADESVVNAEGLVKEFGAVQVLDGLGGFGEGRVLDQGVSLS